MNSALSKMSPGITTMIRMDHAHVMGAFHQFHAGTAPRVKKGLADQICLAIEVHAQLEEEIFYPALRLMAPDEVLEKSTPEHDQMRAHIRTLRAAQPHDANFEATMYELMRIVIHHVADEETTLLPKAERLMGDRLSELGAQMTKRRMQLLGPRSGELAGSMARSMSSGTLLAAAGAVLAAGGYLLARQHPPANESGGWLRAVRGGR